MAERTSQIFPMMKNEWIMMRMDQNFDNEGIFSMKLQGGSNMPVHV